MNEFKLAKGIEASIDGIHECYQIIESSHPSYDGKFYSFLINISIERLPLMIERFIENLDEPCFFILEVPTNQREEEKLRKSSNDPLHCDVYYIDGQSKKELLELFKSHKELLIHDGSRFGFASHSSKDEIYVGKYKVISFYTSNAERLKILLQDFNIPQEEKIKTVWDNFSRQTPGICKTIEVNGKTIYDLIDTLQTKGLYLAERREE